MLPRSHSPYATWAAWLSAFGTGAEEPPEGLPPIDPEVLGGSAVARLSERAAAALQARMDLWLAALRRDFDAVRSPAEFGAALGSARRRLRPIRAFASSPLLMPPLRDALTKALDDSLSQSHRGLIEQLDHDRGRNEQLLRVARENPFERPLTLELEPDDAPAAPGPGRRPILLG